LARVVVDSSRELNYAVIWHHTNPKLVALTSTLEQAWQEAHNFRRRQRNPMFAIDVYQLVRDRV